MSRVKVLLLLAAAVYTVGLTSVNGQDARPVLTSEFQATLESFIHDVMSCRQVPGLTLTVVRGGATWSRGYGMADVDTGRAVDNQTLFGIGSLTKAFTSTLLAVLLNDTEYVYVCETIGTCRAYTIDYRRFTHVQRMSCVICQSSDIVSKL
jgi:CubicO group peptidase (beta-lactamase class C family)